MISWLEKLGLGLKKSSQKIGGGLSGRDRGRIFQNEAG